MNAPGCTDVRPLLEAFVDLELDGVQSSAVREHLALCADCRLQQEEALSIPTRLRALPAPEPPAKFLASVMSAVGSIDGQEEARRKLIWRPVVAEVILSAIIGWYISGFAGLGSLTTATFGELAQLFGWSSGAAALPAAPSADLVLVLACLSLIGVTAYHLMLIARSSGRRKPRERAA